MKNLPESDEHVKVVDFEDGRIAFAAKTRQGIMEPTFNFEDGTYKNIIETGSLQDGSIHYIIFTQS